jgi:hypothetical protein
MVVAMVVRHDDSFAKLPSLLDEFLRVFLKLNPLLQSEDLDLELSTLTL